MPPTTAAVVSTASRCDSMESSITAMTGRRRFASWFQMPVSVTARATSLEPKPHVRRRPYEPAMPTMPPPGATYVNAVEAWVNGSACRNRRPGRATIHGGAYVTTLSTTTPASASSHAVSSCFTTSQTSP